MTQRFSPLVKGIITGVLMVSATLILFYTKWSSPSLEYIVWGLYAGGIAWTLLDYYRSPEYTGRFGDLFGKGFRCFIIVTLILATFAGIFSAMHPEFAEEDAKLYREYLLTEEKDKTLPEIESMVKEEKDNYTVKKVWWTTFGSLIPGAIFTAAGAGLLLMRRR